MRIVDSEFSENVLNVIKSELNKSGSELRNAILSVGCTKQEDQESESKTDLSERLQYIEEQLKNFRENIQQFEDMKSNLDNLKKTLWEEFVTKIETLSKERVLNFETVTQNLTTKFDRKLKNLEDQLFTLKNLPTNDSELKTLSETI